MRRFAAFWAQFWIGPTRWLVGLAVAGYIVWGTVRPAPWIVGWTLMCFAMMIPLLGPQVDYLRRSVSTSWRAGAIAIFLGGYLAVWIVAGLVLRQLSSFASTQLGAGSALVVVLIAAMLWTVSPAAQSSRNACHRTSRMGAFAFEALAGGARYGLRTGRACVLVCWPWMLIPSFMPSGKLATMVAISMFSLADRIAPPAPIAWRLPPALDTIVDLSLLRLNSSVAGR